MQEYSELDRIKNNYSMQITDIKTTEKLIDIRQININELKEKLKVLLNWQQFKENTYFSIPYVDLWYKVKSTKWHFIDNFRWVVIEYKWWQYTCYLSYDTDVERKFII